MTREAMLTSGQLAQSIGVSISSIQRLVAQGMPCEETPGGKRRFSQSIVREWLAKARSARDAAKVEVSAAADRETSLAQTDDGGETDDDAHPVDRAPDARPQKSRQEAFEEDMRSYTDDHDDRRVPACKIEIDGSVVVLSDDSGIVVTIDFSRRNGYLVRVTEDDDEADLSVIY